MISKTLLKTLTIITSVLKRCKIPFVLIGGITTSIWGRPRATYDIDGLIIMDFRRLPELLKKLENKGFLHNKKQPVKQIAQLPFLTVKYKGIYVDLFLATSPHQKETIKRAREISIADGLKIRVAAPENLIIIKLLSGRTSDIEDVREILHEQKDTLNRKYLIRWAKGLGVHSTLQDEIKRPKGVPVR